MCMCVCVCVCWGVGGLLAAKKAAGQTHPGTDPCTQGRMKVTYGNHLSQKSLITLPNQYALCASREKDRAFKSYFYKSKPES